MFRGAAAPNAFDAPIIKATDENLTSEDWGAIIEVCDKVSSDPNGPNQAVQSLIKRLAHRNANVQLYTLELGNALSQNCGKNVHRELSSRAFTDALLKLANDRNTHQQVKAKILERMKEWSDMFSNDADLGIMYDAYYRLKQTNPTLQAPSAPQKNNLTDVDRQKEEEELQIALKLSLQEEERKKKVAESAVASSAGPSTGAGGSASQPTPIPSHPTGTTAATVSRVRALYDFAPSEPGELEFKKGDVIAVLESVYKDWWRGSLKGKTGIFPLNYVEKLTDPTPDELHREAQMEAEVFAEIKNVEKLLTLLSTSNTAPREEDNEEISKLYHQTLAIRPKLIKLIEKYSQKKDDFTQLNENTPRGHPFLRVMVVREAQALDTHLKARLRNNKSLRDSTLQDRRGRLPRPPAAAHNGPRPQSTYGNPQELATSAYDSPIGAPKPGGPSDPYSASVYSQDDAYAPVSDQPSAPPPSVPGPAPSSVPAPLALGGQQQHQQQPQYTAYNPRTNTQNQQQQDTPSYDAIPPPQPTGSAPPIPHQGYGATPPPPLQPSGPAFDARQSLPSQAQQQNAAVMVPAPLQQPQNPQYKAYVPPGAAGEPSAPQDYYRTSAY
ncbi:putative class e vacuolar protein-sorting machinery protein hse1 protein [Eutypa lata UCREL1]|uniref:Class E vacuolar protein-sorting machinery protein HSE1 n=1 Tax=Eutypa lata (strain UCR-EL1) TaxID=1287681 RepID=M7TWT2_EUTLA|nr:putative class e vacuolar protein-sorting machinery protein hse1 protein [Eutypa lata UCREL1]